VTKLIGAQLGNLFVSKLRADNWFAPAPDERPIRADPVFEAAELCAPRALARLVTSRAKKQEKI
jgi:hypothetical protein